jgi:hypothetical protein
MVWIAGRTLLMNTPSQSLDTNQAASVVALPAEAIEALADAGYIDSGAPPGRSRRFNLTDLKAFVARNADNGAGTELRQHFFEADLDPAELIELLDERTEHMALRMLKMYSTVFPQVESWTIERQSHFVLRTKDRFEAIMAVALGNDFDEEFLADLRRIGANAARRGVELPEILVLLRISRDLVVQNAIEIAGDGERHGSFALSLLLTRILPAMDQLSDTLAAGYWQAMFPSR